MKNGLVWLRRDLRFEDNTALHYATEECDNVYLVFVFDTKILNKLNENDRRVSFLWDSLKDISQKHEVIILSGDPVEEIPQLCKKLNISKLFTNEDYESYAIKRDKKIYDTLTSQGTDFSKFLDTLIFHPSSILNLKKEPYKVYSAYKRQWLSRLQEQPDRVRLKVINYKKIKSQSIVKGISSIEEIGFNYTPPQIEKLSTLMSSLKDKVLTYDKLRDIPSVDGTSKLSVYLRFGLLSSRQLLNVYKQGTSEGCDVWISELIWREFYFYILYHFPRVEKNCFLSKFDDLKWDNSKELFKKWCEGNTGVPIVDAGMRQLNESGWMHNRVRMIVASYLCKTLLIDWKWGEKYFAKQLLDFDLAANNGGWQWSASTGCDASPYFRIFNPYTQSKKFDPEAIYIKKWVPELVNADSKELHDTSKFSISGYPEPIVDYSSKRKEALDMYKTI